MKKLLSVLTVILMFFTLTSCNKNESKDEVKTYKDMLNRTVEVTKKPSRIVCIGAGALRLYSYIGDVDLLCGVEDIDKTNTPVMNNLSVRPYQLALAETIDKLPSCGVGGPKAQHPEAEKILSCKPDLVISLMNDIKEINELQNNIKVPVIVLDYGKTEAFDQKLYDSLTLLGDVLDKEDRANKVVDYIKGVEKELKDITNNIKEDEKPSIYLACHAHWGSKGFFSSTTNYSIFNASNIKNVLDVALGKDKGYVEAVDQEILLTKYVPDKVIVDASGIKLFKNEYADNNTAKIFNSMKAFKEGEVYLSLPYNAYYTNIEIACLNAYYAASVSYPELFKDFDINAKGKEMFKFFFGTDVYDSTISKLGYGYGKIDLEKEFPNYAK